MTDKGLLLVSPWTLVRHYSIRCIAGEGGEYKSELEKRSTGGSARDEVGLCRHNHLLKQRQKWPLSSNGAKWNSPLDPLAPSNIDVNDQDLFKCAHFIVRFDALLGYS